MLGRLADFFRFWWGLLYWNVRKSWFQLRGGRTPCPCQSPSDSGRALETQCEACLTWEQPARFRKVCPLLVTTSAGLRCSANTAEVRPFWGRALGYWGGATLGLYAVAVILVFGFLRSVGYPVSIVHVALPPLWDRVGQARGWFALERSHEAFAAGRTVEGLLYLENAYQFDPRNYSVGLALAKRLQAGQPGRSDEVFARLMREHPERRGATAQDWFRALLARGSFDRIAALARDELLRGSPHGAVWLRALIFASRRTAQDAPLRDAASAQGSTAAPWRAVLETEMRIRNRSTAETRDALRRPWPDPTPFSVYYRVATLLELNEPLAAMDLLEQNRMFLDDEAAITLRLDGYARSGASNLRQRQVNLLLGSRLDAPRIKTLCAHLIRHPDTEIFQQLWRKLEHASLPLDGDTAGAWFSVLCAAGAVGETDRLHEITAKLKHASNPPFVALGIVEAYFRGETADRRITTVLPILPLPLEVTYALLERYAPAAGTSAALAKGP